MPDGFKPPLIKTPSDCTKSELAAFCDYVRQGGQVADGLEGRVKDRGKALAFIYSDDGTLAAVGAVKHPYADYQEDKFAKAECSDRRTEFPLELGWCFVNHSLRGKKLSNRLVSALTAGPMGQCGLFATSESENFAMHKALERYGFEVAGKPIPSDRGDYFLKLFLRRPSSLL